MSDEQSPFNLLDEIMKQPLPELESPLQSGSNIFVDPHFVAAFVDVVDKKIRVVGETISVGDYIDRCAASKRGLAEYHKTLGMDRDSRNSRDIVLSYMAKRLARDDVDMAPGHTQRRLVVYVQRYRKPETIGMHPVYRFIRRAEEGGHKSYNIGSLIGIQFLPLLDRYTPLWITYIKEINN